MATYRVFYYIKRNGKEYEASHFAEGQSTKEAIKNTLDYTKQRCLPHPFSPKAKKITDFELSSVNWKKDTVTANYKSDNAADLLFPGKMTALMLATATTFCSTIYNPYAEELMRRAGNLGSFQTANNEHERGSVLRNAAKAFGISLF